MKKHLLQMSYVAWILAASLPAFSQESNIPVRSLSDSSDRELREIIVSSIISRGKLFDTTFSRDVHKLVLVTVQMEQALEILRARFPLRISDSDALIIKAYINSVYELQVLINNRPASLCGEKLDPPVVEKPLYRKDEIAFAEMEYRISGDYMNLFRSWTAYDAEKVKNEFEWHNRITDMYNSAWRNITENLNREFLLECEKLRHERNREFAALRLKIASLGDAIKLSFVSTNRKLLRREGRRNRMQTITSNDQNILPNQITNPYEKENLN